MKVIGAQARTARQQGQGRVSVAASMYRQMPATIPARCSGERGGARAAAPARTEPARSAAAQLSKNVTFSGFARRDGQDGRQ